MEWESFLLSFAVLIFELRIFYRIFKKVNKQNSVFHSYMTKIGTLYFVFLFLVGVFTPLYKFFGLVLSVLPLVLIEFGLFFESKIKKNKVNSDFLNLLRSTEIKMSSGLSFIDAFQLSMKEIKGIKPDSFKKLEVLVSFSQQKNHENLNRWEKEITILKFSTFNTREKLTQLIYKLQNEHEIRHKSRQVLLSLHLQATILAVVYLGVFAFCTLNFGFEDHMAFYLLSFALFSVGCFLIFKTGRRIKWKV